MSVKGKFAHAAILLLVLFIAGCESSKVTKPYSQNPPGVEKQLIQIKTNPDGTLASGDGIEKVKPAPGKGNLQGKVFYNDQPASGIEARLCEKFSKDFGGCSGEIFTATTDAKGVYVITDVPPRNYGGLTVKVFDSGYYIFATADVPIIATYTIEADKTFFAPDTNLYKMDLTVLSPTADSTIGPANIELKWDSYPGAAYYMFSIHPDSSTGARLEYDYIHKRVDGLSFVLDRPLSKGTFGVRVDAYNSNDTKLAQNAEDVKFTVIVEGAK